MQGEGGGDNGHGPDNAHDARKAPKMTVTSPSPPMRPSPPPPSGAAGGMPQQQARWEAGDGGGGAGPRDRYYPPPPRSHGHARPHGYADPYQYSRGDPHGRGAGRRVHPSAVSGGGGGARPGYPVDEEVDDGSVFPHYSSPGGRGGGRGRQGSGGRGGVDGAAGAEGGGPGPHPTWSRRQPPPHHQHPHHQQQQQWPHSSQGPMGVEDRGGSGGGGPPIMDGKGAAAAAAAAATAAAAAAAAGGREGRPRAIGGGVGGGGGDYYEQQHYYPGDRDPGPPRDGGGRGGSGGGGGRGRPGRVPYDVPPSIGGSNAPPAAGLHPYPMPPTRDRDRPVGGRGEGGGDRRSPVHPPVHPPRAHPVAASDDPPPHYVRPKPVINVALCDAVEKIVQHRGERGAGGEGGVRGASSPGVADGSKGEAVGVDRERRDGIGGGGAPTEAKKVAMRICSLIDSFDGRLDEVMADPRARAELESIFPGLDEREFRTMLRGCAEGSQVIHGWDVCVVWACIPGI